MPKEPKKFVAPADSGRSPMGTGQKVVMFIGAFVIALFVFVQVVHAVHP
jgi:hypothetical protein